MSQDEDLFGITFDKNDVIFHEGDMGDTMYIIQSGIVEISRIKDCNKNVLAILEKGNFFGEMALIDKCPVPQQQRLLAKAVFSALPVIHLWNVSGMTLVL